MSARGGMRAAAGPAAPHVVVHDRRDARDHLACASYPLVMKADGLAAGKGVVFAADEAEGRRAVETFFTQQRFGETQVVAEEFLTGPELSLLALCDGENAIPMAPAQDYKRIFDGDEGPNTGGMGSYSPVPGIDAQHARALAHVVHPPIVGELRAPGTPLPGVRLPGALWRPAGA